MRIIFILLLFSAVAESHECSIIDDSLKRLACFDAAFPKEQAESDFSNEIQDDNIYGALKEENDVIIGSWLLKNNVDEMTGKTSWQAINMNKELDAVNGLSLLLSCGFRKEPFIGIFSPKYLGLTGKEMLVKVKFGEEDVYSESWIKSTRNALTRNYSNKKNVKFLKKLLSNTELMLRVAPYNSGYVTSSFDLTGITDIIKKIRKECPAKEKYWES